MDYRSATDESLVSACLARREGAWDAFVDRFSRLIYWAVRRSLEKTPLDGREDVVADIFQDIFRRLLERDELSKLRDRASLKRFLCVMACHETLDRAKASTRHESKKVSLDDLSVPTPGPDFLGEERERLLKQAISELSPKERACVEFHYLEEMTHRDISEVLGLPQDTVSSIIRRTREKLRALLEQKGLFD